MIRMDYLIVVQEEHRKIKQLKKKCEEGLKERFGNNISSTLQHRLSWELEHIEEYQFSSYYLEMYDYIRKSNLKPWNLSYQGTTGSSLICYLCGITNINPLNERFPLYPEFFMGYQGNKVPYFNLSTSENSATVAMIEKLVALTGKYPTIEEITTKEQIDSFKSNLDVLPIGDIDSLKEIFEDLNPNNMDEIIRAMGMACSDVSIKEISCREDVYEAVLACGIDKKTAFCIAEYTRRGDTLKMEWQTLLLQRGFPKEFLKVCNETKYLCTRAHVIETVLSNLRILYYIKNYPNEFQQIREV